MKKRIVLIGILATVAAIMTISAFSNSIYRFPVLMYHSIGYEDRDTKLCVSPESFEAQMKFLHDRRYNVIGLSEAAQYIRNGKRPPPRTVAITFDDGFYNNYRYAYPVLKKYAIPVTIFVITDKIGISDNFLNWEQIKEMSDSGIVTIGSHTASHKWLPSLSSKEIERQLILSKNILEARLGKRVDLLCYPLGAFDVRVEKLAKRAGYICAVTTNPARDCSRDDAYAIGRIKISRTSYNLAVFWFETSGYYSWVKEMNSNY